jgi:hypothetical protein
MSSRRADKAAAGPPAVSRRSSSTPVAGRKRTRGGNDYQSSEDDSPKLNSDKNGGSSNRGIRADSAGRFGVRSNGRNAGKNKASRSNSASSEDVPNLSPKIESASASLHKKSSEKESTSKKNREGQHSKRLKHDPLLGNGSTVGTEYHLDPSSPLMGAVANYEKLGYQKIESPRPQHKLPPRRFCFERSTPTTGLEQYCTILGLNGDMWFLRVLDNNGEPFEEPEVDCISRKVFVCDYLAEREYLEELQAARRASGSTSVIEILQHAITQRLSDSFSLEIVPKLFTNITEP